MCISEEECGLYRGKWRTGEDDEDDDEDEGEPVTLDECNLPEHDYCDAPEPDQVYLDSAYPDYDLT